VSGLVEIGPSPPVAAPLVLEIVRAGDST